MNRPPLRIGGAVLLAVLALHVLLGLARLPNKVWGRRLDQVDAYRKQGAAEFLLEGARLEGAHVITWIRDHVPADQAVLWRWPADGALEFVAGLIAPRLLVDERAVEAGAELHAGRRLTRGVIPSGGRGLIVVQGTETGGLRLLVRED